MEIDQQKKEFDKWVKRQLKKPSDKELKEIKKLQKQALSLWRKAVIKNAGKQCEAVEPNGKRCKKTKRLNSHHLESYSTNKILRFDLYNGMALCPTHHKFGRISAHKSFCMIFNLMTQNRKNDLDYLLGHYKDKVELTKEFLLKKIKELSK